MLFNTIVLHSILLLSAVSFNDYWIKQGDRAFGNQQVEESILHYSRAIEERPKHPLGYIKRAKAYRASGQYVRSAEDMRIAVELDPDFTKSYLYASKKQKILPK